jgi:spermidine/putrescine transport system substrate-binding protein
LNAENQDQWQFILPEAGGMLWSDNLMIPIGSPYKENAETLINYYYEPEIAAKVAAYVQYVCPVKGARNQMEKIDPGLADTWLIFPSDHVLAKVHMIRSLNAQEETTFNQKFQEVLGV